jgi:hypothetical protein
MELHTYVAQVRTQLEAAAALGDDRARDIAAALSAAAEPAVQLALVGALSAGADEITAALLDAPGAPAVTLRFGDDRVLFDVRHYDEVARTPPAADDADATARISLRLPEALKTDIEAAAKSDSVSVNTWLVRAAAAALSSPGGAQPHDGTRRSAAGTQRISGWING